MSARDVAMVVAIMVSLGLIALLFFAPLARATESDRYPPTHQIVVCVPGKDCERRGRAMGATACSLDAASEKLLANLPSGTWIACVRIAK